MNDAESEKIPVKGVLIMIDPMSFFKWPHDRRNQEIALLRRRAFRSHRMMVEYRRGRWVHSSDQPFLATQHKR
jgi:hypothetical protein